jgi:cytochrome c oxidase assembly factor CtaG
VTSVAELLPAIALAAAGLLYARRAATLARRGRPVPAAKQVSFFAGLLLLAVALASPLHGVAEERLFWVHMVQHLLLGDLAALAIVFGLNGPLLRPLLAFRAIRSLRVLAHPWVALPLWTVNLVLWHLPGPYQAALDHAALHGLEHLLFFTTGALMWAAVLEPLPGPRWFGAGAQAVYVLAVRTVGAALASVFIWSGQVLYPAYGPGERLEGIAPLTDQQIGGAIMFVEGGVVTLLAFAWAFLRWMGPPDRGRAAMPDLPPPPPRPARAPARAGRPPAARGTPGGR